MPTTENDEWNMTPVTSENLAEVGFNPETKQGRVLFNSGALYEYDRCTQEEADQIINAPSANDAFTVLWRGSRPYRRIG